MALRLAHPHVSDPLGAINHPCTSCEARPLSICNVIADPDLTRLASIATVVEAPAGHCFIDEGEPARCFFNITAGTAKLFKLLPDGRRQITGFVGPGHFLGLAVSDTYAFSAEAIERVRFCRFQRGKLRALLDDFPEMEKRLSTLEKRVDAMAKPMPKSARKPASGARAHTPKPGATPKKP